MNTGIRSRVQILKEIVYAFGCWDLNEKSNTAIINTVGMC